MGFSFIKTRKNCKTEKWGRKLENWKIEGKKKFKLNKNKNLKLSLVNFKNKFKRKMSVCYLKISLNTAVSDREHSCSSITQRQL